MTTQDQNIPENPQGPDFLDEPIKGDSITRIEVTPTSPLDETSNTVQKNEETGPVSTMDDSGDVVVDDSSAAEAVVVEATQATEEEAEEVIERPRQYVTQGVSVNQDVKVKDGEILNLPSTFEDETARALNKTPNVALLDTQKGREWAETVKESLGYIPRAELFEATLQDPTASFNNDNQHNGLRMNSSLPRMSNIENETLAGERAVIRIANHLGLGSLFQTALWHSGLWVTFKPPSETELVELNRLIAQDKIQMGRQTYGLAFNNSSSYTAGRLVDFAIDHIYDLSAKAEGINSGNIKHHISIQDLPMFLWGFLCTMYPRGFRYRRACTANPEKCQHVIEDTLNLTKLQWTNMSALSEWQKVHMSGKQSKQKDLDSIKRYKEELTRLQKKTLYFYKDTDREIRITLKTPTIHDYIESGHRWIGDIDAIVEKTLGIDAKTSERNDLMIQHGQASAMRDYGHWVEDIQFQTNMVTETEAIEKVLDTISQDETLRTDLIEGVIKFINESTVSLIGIPAYDCPACGGLNEDKKYPHHTSVIPLDVIQTFFALAGQRLLKLQDR